MVINNVHLGVGTDDDRNDMFFNEVPPLLLPHFTDGFNFLIDFEHSDGELSRPELQDIFRFHRGDLTRLARYRGRQFSRPVVRIEKHDPYQVLFNRIVDQAMRLALPFGGIERNRGIQREEYWHLGKSTPLSGIPRSYNLQIFFRDSEEVFRTPEFFAVTLF